MLFLWEDVCRAATGPSRQLQAACEEGSGGESLLERGKVEGLVLGVPPVGAIVEMETLGPFAGKRIIGCERQAGF